MTHETLKKAILIAKEIDFLQKALAMCQEDNTVINLISTRQELVSTRDAMHEKIRKDMLKSLAHVIELKLITYQQDFSEL